MNKFINTIFLLSFSVILFSSCSKEDVVASIPLPEGFIENDWSATKEAAANAERNIVIHFYKPNCDKCAAFKEDVLNDTEVEEYVAENYIGATLDTKEEEGEKLADDFDLKGHPAFAITDQDGNLIASKLGSMGKEVFLEWINEHKK